MLDIQALRERRTKGETAGAIAAEIVDDPEIVQAGFRYECQQLAAWHYDDDEQIDWLLDRLEHWRKGGR